MNKLETIKLDNGLTIYLYNDQRRHSTFFQFITFFGGVTKDFKFRGSEYHFQDGIAHILEHYVVECNDQGNFLKELGKRQMNTNASTHCNMTRFYFDAVEDVNFGIQTMLNGINNVTFSEEKLEKLKNPIYQEIRGRMDNKFYHSNNMAINNLFNKIKFRNIGGTIDEVREVTCQDIKVCYEAFYQPKNQAIVVAGNFNKEEVLKEIKNFYKNLERNYDDVELLEVAEEVEVRKKEDTLVFPTPTEYLEISFKIDISKYSPTEQLNLDFYLGCFYSHYFGVTSKVYKELVDKKVITSGINCGDVRIANFLIINIGAYTYDVEYFKKKIFESVTDPKDFDFEKFELDKKSAIINLILRDDNIINMIMPFVDNLVNFKYPYLDTVEDIEGLNFDDYVKMIKNIDFSNYTITTISENKKS